MIEPEYRVISEGRVKPGNDPASVKQHVAVLFKSDAAKIDRLFAGREVIVKSRIPFDVADKYLNALNRAGLVCRVEPEAEVRGNSDAPKGPVADAGARTSAGQIQGEELPICPACGYQARDKNDDLIVKYDGMGECPACGIIVSKYLAAKEGKREEESQAEPRTAPAAARENGDEQDQPAGSLSHRVGAFWDRVIGRVSGSAASPYGMDENQALNGWPLYWRGCVLLSLVVALLFGWNAGAAAAVVTIPSYWAYFVWTRDRGAVVFYAVCTGGGIFALLGVSYVVRAACAFLQKCFGVVKFKRHFLTTALVLLLIASVLSLFSPQRMGLLPAYDHTKGVSANAQP